VIQFILSANKLGQNPTGFHAVTLQSENRTSADFIKTMTSLRGGSTEGECAMWLDLVVRTFIFELQQGNNVVIDGFINARITIKGSFPDAESPFDSARNTITVTITPATKVKKAVIGSPVQHITDAGSGIYITHVLDMGSATDNSALTPGNVLKIFGSKIKIEGNLPGVGITFINAEGDLTPVPANALSRNTAKELNLVVPILPPGTYHVEVTTQYSGSQPGLTEPRSYLFASVLTIAGE
jgi:hypothetical protein